MSNNVFLYAYRYSNTWPNIGLYRSNNAWCYSHKSLAIS